MICAQSRIRSVLAPARRQSGCKYELVSLPREMVERWDELTGVFPGRTLFHRRVWLDYLAASRGLQLSFWSICERSSVVGYFCGGVIQRGPFRILGSPLQGWGSNLMGPVAGADMDERAFLAALDRLAREERYAMVEIEGPALSDEALQGAGYEPVDQPTYIVELMGDPARMWERLERKSCRYEINKAKRLGVRVELADDEGFADEFYDEFVEALARKQLYPPYERRTAHLLLKHLRGQDLLYSFRVIDPTGATVATGIFPHDDYTVYFWGGASRIASWTYSPNDLLQWTLMETAASRGLRSYNMCGFGRFKSKFGGRLVTPRRWHRFYSEFARLGRAAYSMYFRNHIRFRGWLSYRALRSAQTKVHSEAK